MQIKQMIALWSGIEKGFVHTQFAQGNDAYNESHEVTKKAENEHNKHTNLNAHTKLLGATNHKSLD